MGFAGKQAPQESDKHASITMILIELSDLSIFISELCRAPVMAAFLGMAFKGLGSHSRCQHGEADEAGYQTKMGGEVFRRIMMNISIVPIAWHPLTASLPGNPGGLPMS